MYNKLFTKILDSSIWLEPMPTRIVWVTFIATMDQDGVVALSGIGNVAARARVSEEEATEAIKCLESPDLRNPGQEHEGRRVERIPGIGWIVLNAKKYRDIIKAETARALTRARVATYRSKKAGNAPVTLGNAAVTPPSASACASEPASSVVQEGGVGETKPVGCGEGFMGPGWSKNQHACHIAKRWGAVNEKGQEAQAKASVHFADGLRARIDKHALMAAVEAHPGYQSWAIVELLKPSLAPPPISGARKLGADTTDYAKVLGPEFAPDYVPPPKPPRS